VSALFVVLPLALLVVLVALGAYLWAARHGQFDDLTTPALRMLNEEEPGPHPAAPRGGPGPPPSPPEPATGSVAAGAAAADRAARPGGSRSPVG
jgi:cbb3-type cytochrome oxidase maturation protein